MSQTYDFPVTGNPVLSAYNTNIDNTFKAVVSCHLGTTAPTTTFAGMFWFDSTSGWMKIRNSADTAWQELWPTAKRVILTQVVLLGAVSATKTEFVGAMPSDSVISRVGVFSNGPTTSSTSGNDLSFMLTKTTGTPANLFSGTPSTFTNIAGVGGGNELAADTIEWFTADAAAAATISAGDTIELAMTFNGTFSWSGLRVGTVLEYYTRP